MTTWLEFRSEPLSEVPTVEIRKLDTTFEVVCTEITCDFQEEASDIEEADEIQSMHIHWHEEGMPQ